MLTSVVLKKKYDKTGEDIRYHGTMLGEPIEPRAVVVEGSDVTSIKEWAAKLRHNQRGNSVSTSTSRRQSSDLSSLDGTMDDDHDMEDITDF
jgi:transcription initiation factor TFIID subunit 3